MEKIPIFSKSDNFKSEYCCSIVRIGEIVPVEGSDFLVKTDIIGTQIVGRKEQIHEGDIMFYAANETALNEKFLSINNLFEIGCREKNSNYEEVKLIMDDYDTNYRNEADELRIKAKTVKSKINSHTNYAARCNKQIKKLQKELKDYEEGKLTSSAKSIEEIQDLIKASQDKADDATAKAMTLTVEYTNTKKRIEELVQNGQPIVDKAKKLCGFFNRYGRVRCITLKGEPSFGFVFSKDEMAKFCPEVKDVNLEDYLDEDFDTVNGELFVKAFVPPIKPQKNGSGKKNKCDKKLKSFDRLLEGEFTFHYDTQMLKKSMFKFTPETDVVISLKIHGTSCIFSKLHVREPKKIAIFKRIWNKIVDMTGLFKKSRFIDYDIVYGPVYSSRTVIKNRYINKEVASGYYEQDVWSEYGDIIYPYLNEGMSVYGEIFGYITDSESMIQKLYDYGCEKGQNKIMLYRISTINEDGTKKEWEVEEVYNWTLNLIERMKENEDENYTRIHPIDILYSGTLEDLYPELNPDEHWKDEFIKKISNDKEHFKCEEFEPLCNNTVPREGICIRIKNDPVNECFKNKNLSFLEKEAILIDSGEVDMEMADNYGDITATDNGDNIEN